MTRQIDLSGKFYWGKEREEKEKNRKSSACPFRCTAGKRVGVDGACLLKGPLHPLTDIAVIGPWAGQGTDWVHPARRQWPA